MIYIYIPYRFPSQGRFTMMYKWKNMEIRLKEGVHLGSRPKWASPWRKPNSPISLTSIVESSSENLWQEHSPSSIGASSAMISTCQT